MAVGRHLKIVFFFNQVDRVFTILTLHDLSMSLDPGLIEKKCNLSFCMREKMARKTFT